MASEASVSKDTIILLEYINIVPARVGLKNRWAVYRKQGKDKTPWDIAELKALQWSNPLKLKNQAIFSSWLASNF